MSKRLQNRIAESRWALTVTAAYAIGVGLLEVGIGGWNWQKLVSLLLLTATTAMMVQLNNANSLIRIYSRLVSCSFLIMTVMCPAILQEWQYGAVQLTLTTVYVLLFRTYQEPEASGSVFYAFCVLSIGSLVFGKMLLLVPLLWILMAAQLQSFSLRTFMASLLGTALPYGFALAWQAYAGDIASLADCLADIVSFQPLGGLAVLTPAQIATLSFVFILGAAGSIHFLAYSYQDKIRTRMLYETLIVMDAALFAAILLQPAFLVPLLAMVIVTTAPLAGHMFALTNSRASNAAFLIAILAALLLTAYNQWTA